MKKIKETVRAIVLKELALENEPVNDSDCFQADHGMDDLDIIEMMMKVEDHFDIRFTDEQTRRATSLAACYELVEQNLSQAV